MKVFISQLMKEKTDEEILKTREYLRAKVTKELESRGVKEVEFIDTMVHDVPETCQNVPVWFLADSIKKLSEADYAYFEQGWVGARRCSVEHKVCLAYNIPILKLSERM